MLFRTPKKQEIILQKTRNTMTFLNKTPNHPNWNGWYVNYQQSDQRTNTKRQNNAKSDVLHSQSALLFLSSSRTACFHIIVVALAYHIIMYPSSIVCVEFAIVDGLWHMQGISCVVQYLHKCKPSLVITYSFLQHVSVCPHILCYMHLLFIRCDW